MQRRDALRWVAAIGSVGTVGSMAGCTSIPGIEGGPGASSKFDEQWMYEPGTIRDQNHYGFYFLKPSAIAEAEDEFDDDVFDRLEGTEDRYEGFTDIGFEDVKGHLSFDLVDVVSASYNRDEVVEELEDEDFDEEDEEGDYTIFVHDDDTYAAAVGATTLVVGRQPPSEEVDIEDLVVDAIATHDGEEDLYVEEVDPMGTLLDNLGAGTILSGQTQEPTSLGNTENTELISIGDTVTGELTADDPYYPDTQKNYDGYAFYATPGTTVTISMTSEPGDPLLALEDPDGNIIGTDDDGGSGYNSRLQAEISTEGVQRIIATHYGSDQRFPYELTLEASGDVGSAGSAGLFEDEVGRGSAFTVDGEATGRTSVVVFDDSADDHEDALVSWVDDGDTFSEYDDVEVSYDGSAAVVTAMIDTDDITEVGI